MDDFKALCGRLGMGRDLPYDECWSAAPDFLELITGHVLAAKPATIVECSSGATTLLLARCCELNGHGGVISLENGPEFAAAARRELARHGLSHRATVLDAPLVPTHAGGRDMLWYDPSSLPELSIDMLVIDGPSGFIQPLSRYPALPMLHDRLSQDAVIYLDDAARPDEREIVTRWLDTFPEFEYEYVEAERGCTILRRRSV